MRSCGSKSQLRVIVCIQNPSISTTITMLLVYRTRNTAPPFSSKARNRPKHSARTHRARLERDSGSSRTFCHSPLTVMSLTSCIYVNNRILLHRKYVAYYRARYNCGFRGRGMEGRCVDESDMEHLRKSRNISRSTPKTRAAKNVSKLLTHGLVPL